MATTLADTIDIVIGPDHVARIEQKSPRKWRACTSTIDGPFLMFEIGNDAVTTATTRQRAIDTLCATLLVMGRAKEAQALNIAA